MTPADRQPVNRQDEYHESCDMGEDGGPCEHCLEMRRLRGRVRDLEAALRETDERIERGRHAFEMLRHWQADGRPSKVMPWVETFLREGGVIFSRRAALAPAEER